MTKIDYKKSLELLEAFKVNDYISLSDIIKGNIPSKKKSIRNEKGLFVTPRRKRIQKIDINVASEYTGMTMLMYAIKHKEPLQVKLLLSLAQYPKHFTRLKLVCKDKDNNNIMHLAIRTGVFKLISKIVLNKFPINELNNLGFAPLHIAALKGDIEAATAILKKNASKVNIRNKIQATPLMLAAENGKTEMIRLLLSNKASERLKDLSDRTARDYARDNYMPYPAEVSASVGEATVG